MGCPYQLTPYLNEAEIPNFGLGQFEVLWQEIFTFKSRW